MEKIKATAKNGLRTDIFRVVDEAGQVRYGWPFYVYDKDGEIRWATRDGMTAYWSLRMT